MNLLEPTNHRISNSLFDAINRVRNGVAESTVATEGAVDKAHFCATHVEHALLGKGVCISEQHAEPDENGNIEWYSVEFPSGIQRVNTSNLKITEGKSHTHGKKMAEEQEQIDELSINTLTRVKSAATSAASDASREGDEDKATKRYNLAGNASNKIEKANRAAGLKPSGQHQFGEGEEQIIEYGEPSKYGSTVNKSPVAPAPKTNSGMKTKAGDIPPKHQVVKHLIGTSMDPRYSKPNNSPDMKTKNEGNDGNLANNAKPYDKVTRGDVITGRLGKDEMGGKKKKVAAESAPIAQDKIAFNDVPKPVSKSTEDKEKKGAMSKAASAHSAGKGGTDAPKASTVGEARSTGTVFDKPKDNPLTKDIKSSFNKKQVSTGTVYTRKPQKDMDDKGKKIKSESVTQTIINHNDFVLEVTDNPTYGDYLRALQSMVGQSNEDIQQEIVTIATEAFNEQYTDIIIESQTKKIFESKFEDIRMSGGKVLGENYMVDSGEPYVEYTVEKDGKAIQYVHLGTIKKV